MKYIQLETNFPANILIHLDMVAAGRAMLDLELIRRNALKEIDYLSRIRAMSAPKSWEIK